MSHLHIALAEPGKTGLVTAGIAVAAQYEANSGTIEVDLSIYSMICVGLGLIGVYVARLVTIETEDRVLGRSQTLRETGPLTWVALLIVGPVIWHFKISVPFAACLGLGVGYSVRLILKILGRTATGVIRTMVKEAGRALDSEGLREATGKQLRDAYHKPLDEKLPEDQQQLIGKLDEE